MFWSITEKKPRKKSTQKFCNIAIVINVYYEILTIITDINTSIYIILVTAT